MCVLTQIQNKLKAPKNQQNTFGNYKYRSCEDILEAVKPILKEYDAQLTITDDIVQIGNRIYVKATATIGIKDGGMLSVCAYAREEESKKGMDSAQITGACSSYARKYALNGLFLIDDTKDADTQDNTKQTSQKQQEPQKQTAQEVVKEVYDPTPDQMKKEMSDWFTERFGEKALEEWQKFTNGKIDNPLTMKNEGNIKKAYSKYLTLRSENA